MAGWASAVGVAALGCLLTLVGTLWLRGEVQRDAEVRFERYNTALEDNIAARFQRVMFGFEGLRSYFDAVDGNVHRLAFRSWATSRNVNENFPGIRGFGFIARVDRAALPSWVAAEQADDGAGFQVRTQGTAPDLYVIKLIEPLANNGPAWGYDIGSEAVRREAAEHAVSSGQPTLTGRITLVQDGQRRPGYLYFLPVYKKGLAVSTPDQRRAALLGLIYAPIVTEEFLHGLADVTDGNLDVTIYDGAATQAERLVYSLGSDAAGQAEPGHAQPWLTGRYARVAERQLTVGGRELLLQTRPTPKFHSGVQYMAPVWFALFGLLLSSLLAATVRLLVAGRSRAEALAQRMTADLQEAKLSAETALRDGKALLDTLNQFSLVSVADWAGNIVEVNDAFCELSGYARHELIGQNHRIVNSGQHDAAFWSAMWQQISSGAPWSGEICNRAKDGRLYWVHSIIAPFVGADGHIEKYVSIRTDITARHHAEQELREMAERYTLAIEGGNDGIWDWMNLHDQAEWWSPQCYRLLGYQPNEIPADLATFDHLLHPDHQAANLAALEAALKNAKPYEMEYQLRTKSGEYRWFRARAKVFFDEQGHGYRMAGSLQDVHERRMAQDALKEYGERLAAVLSLSPDGFVSFGADDRVGYVSPAFTALTGLAAGAVIGLEEPAFLAEFLKGSAQGAGATRFDELREQRARDPLAGLRGARDSVVLEMLQPQRRVLELRMRQGTGTAVHKVLHLRDITKASEVDQVKSAFLSVAAHELRTPMASIYGFTELLLMRELKPEKQRELLGRIHRQSETMMNILNELLDLARLDARRGKDFLLESLDLAEVVNHVVRDFNPPPGRDAPQIEQFDWLLATMPVRADRQKLSRAVLNVLSNAYKYSPQGGLVRVCFEQTVQADGGLLHGVRIIDRGIGMSAEQLARVGERFYRADKSGNIPGTGLGVSIVTEVMEQMGGHIELRSVVGQGTEVTLWLPAHEHHSRAGADTQAAPLLDLAEAGTPGR